MNVRIFKSFWFFLSLGVLYASACLANPPLLPKRTQNDIDLYAWLSTFEESDFDVPFSSVTFSLTSQTVRDLYGLHFTCFDPALTKAMARYPSNAFVLDDGTGEGIEGDGVSPRILGNSSRGHGYNIDGAELLKLSGPGLNNPYENNVGLANRITTQSVAFMMAVNEALYYDGGLYFNDYVGMEMAQAIFGFRESKDYANGMTSVLEEAFYEVVYSVMSYWANNGGARDVNSNMDTYAIWAGTMLYNELMARSKTTEAGNVLAWVKYEMLGNAPIAGDSTGQRDFGILFNAAGYIGEGNMPEAGYQGISYYFITLAAQESNGIEGWEWLWDTDGVFDRMSKLKAYQIFPEPDGSNRFNGPSGYSIRTSDPASNDQSNTMGMSFVAAQLSDYALSFFGKKYRKPSWYSQYYTLVPPTLSTIDKNIGGRHLRYNYDASDGDFDPVPIEYFSMGAGSGDSRYWSHRHGYPAHRHYDPTFYDRILNLIADDDPVLKLPVERKGVYYNVTFKQNGQQPEFWAFKGKTDSKDFAVFIESYEYQGTNILYENEGGWRGGGSLQTFWTEDAGTVINTRRPYYLGVQDGWPFVETWATHHLWGELTGGVTFSSAQKHSRQAYTTYDDTDNPTTVTSTSTPDRSDKGSYAGTVTYTRQFTKTTEGLTIQTTLSTSSEDQFTSIWESIPVFVSLDKSENATTTIEYLDGSSWTTMPTNGSSVSTSKIRLGRDHGNGPAYVYIRFEQAQSVRLANEWQCDGEVEDYYRQLMIDLHPNSGSAQTVSRASVSYTISSFPTSTNIERPENVRVVR